MITIYSPYHSSRLIYILDYLFRDRLGIDWQLSDSRQMDKENPRLWINYSNEKIDGSCTILPEGLLSETGLSTKNIQVTDYSGLKVIFPNNGDTGFDIFSALFYCLSRYEEYGDVHKDLHGRYPYTASFQYKNNCLDLPLVDLWVAEFRNLLSNKYGFKKEDFRAEEFKVLPTIDIDAAFTYKGRSFVRQVAGFAKAALQLNFYEFMKRYKVSFRGENDPNDNFNYQFEKLKEAGQSVKYFIQIGDYGKFDKNINASDKSFQSIIQSITANGHEVGLHPSYQSNGDKNIILKEKETLENIIGRPVISSRQHYLRFRLPDTYRALMETGIRKEYSMGYSEVTGFRAATSQPFYWYDLGREKATELEIVPFCAMDVAYKQFLKSTAEKAITDSLQIRKIIESAGGVFCTVFHNESLSSHRGWEGWRKVFEEWIKK